MLPLRSPGVPFSSDAQSALQLVLLRYVTLLRHTLHGLLYKWDEQESEVPDDLLHKPASLSMDLLLQVRESVPSAGLV
jgi:hypothetical protein